MITITATNCAGEMTYTATHGIIITAPEPEDFFVYIPIIMKDYTAP